MFQDRAISIDIEVADGLRSVRAKIARFENGGESTPMILDEKREESKLLTLMYEHGLRLYQLIAELDDAEGLAAGQDSQQEGVEY